MSSCTSSRWRDGEPRPENRGSFNLTQEGAPDERDQHCQSAASAYDRRHGCAQAQPAHAAQPHLQLHLVEGGASICNRNRIMTGVRFLFRVTLRRHELAAEIWHIKEPQKLPP